MFGCKDINDYLCNIILFAMVPTLLVLLALGAYVLFCYYKGRDGEAENESGERLEKVDCEELLRIPTRVLVMRILDDWVRACGGR